MKSERSENIFFRSRTCYQNHFRKIIKITTADVIGLCFSAETKLLTTGSLFSHEKYKLTKICQKMMHTVCSHAQKHLVQT